MSDDTVISVENVSKAYRIWQTPGARLTSPLLSGIGRSVFGDSPPGLALQRRAAAGFHDFCALNEISFKVRRGEAVGIIGRNGSGKSTLLQVIAGTLQPTSGNVKVRGRVAALLELGSGFNPEFTGRENVFLNGAVLGLTHEEIEKRFDAIAAFANIGEFIEQPVRTYSSGMVVRLAFAVAAHVEPDILIVDEALSVGDARFQLKCARTIDRFLEEGVTLLFVSHDLSMVKRLCSQAILLEKGRIIHSGSPNDVANLYSKLIADGGSAEALSDDIRALKERESKPHVPNEPASEDEMKSGPAESATASGSDNASAENHRLLSRIKALEAILTESGTDASWNAKVDAMLRNERLALQGSPYEFAYGGEIGRITDFTLVDRTRESRTWFTTGEDVEVRLSIEARSDIEEPIFAMTIKDKKGQDIYGTNTLYSRQP
ncbi:MAG TPA: ABC transporter ATP-binding protein, partial [Opitutaceae bacterium]